eukprot:5663115-Amphidinium_carterae.1
MGEEGQQAENGSTFPYADHGNTLARNNPAPMTATGAPMLVNVNNPFPVPPMNQLTVQNMQRLEQPVPALVPQPQQQNGPSRTEMECQTLASMVDSVLPPMISMTTQRVPAHTAGLSHAGAATDFDC